MSDVRRCKKFYVYVEIKITRLWLSLKDFHFGTKTVDSIVILQSLCVTLLNHSLGRTIRVLGKGLSLSNAVLENMIDAVVSEVWRKLSVWSPSRQPVVQWERRNKAIMLLNF